MVGTLAPQQLSVVDNVNNAKCEPAQTEVKPVLALIIYQD